ncbi:MAG: hypothetical protein IJK60_07325 [Clostridia bacterium]|nr:hypothetical protein [Clostridia bacterium]
MCFALASCSVFQVDEPVITVSGAEVDKEIFAYYFDKVVARPSNYGLDEKASPEDCAGKAVELCTRYVTVNTMFEKYNLRLTPSQKYSIADEVGNKWTCYGNHYKKIGVSRAAISKIVTNETYEDTIFTTLFDNSDEEAEKKVRKYFADNYIVFRAVCGYFITTDAAGSDIEMSDAEKDKVETRFRSLAEKIVDISGIEAAANELNYTASSAILLKKTQCEGYPDGFFEDVNSLQNDSASVLRYDDCIFIIWKYNPDDREEEYASCRSQCVKDMYSAFGEASFRSLEETFEITRSEPMINSFVRNIEIYG